MIVFAVGFIFSVTSMKSDVSASALSGVKRVEHSFENHVASFGRVITWPGDRNVLLEQEKNLEKEQVVKKYSAPYRWLTRLGMGHEKQNSVGLETTEQNLVERMLGKSSYSPGGSWMNSLGLRMPSSLTPGRKKKGPKPSEGHQKEYKEPSTPRTPLKKAQAWLSENIMYKKRANDQEMRIVGTRYRTLPWIKPRNKASPSPVEHQSTFDNRIRKQDIPPELSGFEQGTSGQTSGLPHPPSLASWVSQDPSPDSYTPRRKSKSRHQSGNGKGSPPKTPSKKFTGNFWSSKEKERDTSRASQYIDTPPSRPGRSSPYSETPSRSSPWKTWVPKFRSTSDVPADRIPTIPDFAHEHVLSTTIDGKVGFISSENPTPESNYHIPANEPLPKSVYPVDLDKFLRGNELDAVIKAEELESYSTNQLSNDDINKKFNELLKKRHERFAVESERNDPDPPPPPPPAPVQQSTGSPEKYRKEKEKEKPKGKRKLVSFENDDHSGLTNTEIDKIYRRLSSRAVLESPEVETYKKAEDNFLSRRNPGSPRNESPSSSPKRKHPGSPTREHSGSPKRKHPSSPTREHSGSPKRKHPSSPTSANSGSARRKHSVNRGTIPPDHESDSEKVREETKDIEDKWGKLQQKMSQLRGAASNDS